MEEAEEPNVGPERPVKKGSSSRSESPQDWEAPQLNSSRGVEEHRADPALRQALDKLDSLRNRQPTVDDFALEHYMGPRPDAAPAAAPASTGSTRSSANSARSAPHDQQSSSQRFSLDLLMAAATGASPIPSRPARRDGGMTASEVGYPSRPPRHLASLPAESSRSTTPGSGPASSFSGSFGSLTCASTFDTLNVDEQAEPLQPRPPPVRPPASSASGPRRPGGRPRVESARRRRIQAAVESAAHELRPYGGSHSAR